MQYYLLSISKLKFYTVSHCTVFIVYLLEKTLQKAVFTCKEGNDTHTFVLFLRNAKVFAEFHYQYHGCQYFHMLTISNI